MSTYYSCDACGTAFDEYDAGGACEECDKSLCPDCYEEFIGDNVNECISVFRQDECPFCTKSVVRDSDLLSYALERLNMTREELESDWINGDG